MGLAESNQSPGSLARPLRILQVVGTVEREASGLARAVPGLCGALAGAGHEVVLASVGGVWFSGEQPYEHHIAPRQFGNIPILKKLWLSSHLRRQLMHDAKWADIVQSHSLWVMPNVYPAWASAKSGKPLIVSPHGTLSPAALNFSYYTKRLFWLALQGRAVRTARCLHATSEAEYLDFRRFGLCQPIAIIPNGIDIPSDAPPKQLSKAMKTVLYLGRIHPKKGIKYLIYAWKQIHKSFPDWQLQIVGPGPKKHVGFLNAIICQDSLERVTLEGPVYGHDKTRVYREADLFVLPTLNENFGLAVAESLALGTPVISSKGAPWSGLVTNQCGWWIDHGAEPLAACFREALALEPEKLAKMGTLGRQWIERDFSWSRVAQDFERAYRWILSGGSPPAFVKLN